MIYYMTRQMYLSIVSSGQMALTKAGVISYIYKTFGLRETITDIRITD